MSQHILVDSAELGEHPFAQLAAMIVPGTKARDWR